MPETFHCQRLENFCWSRPSEFAKGKIYREMRVSGGVGSILAAEWKVAGPPSLGYGSFSHFGNLSSLDPMQKRVQVFRGPAQLARSTFERSRK
jgi:hypothetical protein